jgi:hypothetical protein
VAVDKDGTAEVLETNPSGISGNKRTNTGSSNSEVTAICHMEKRHAAELLAINLVVIAAMVRTNVLPVSNTINVVTIIVFPSGPV